MHQPATETTSPEQERRSIASSTTALISLLQIKTFSTLEPSDRATALTSLSIVLRSPFATNEGKRQLITFVDGLLRSKDINRQHKGAIADLLMKLKGRNSLSGNLAGDLDRILDWWNGCEFS